KPGPPRQPFRSLRVAPVPPVRRGEQSLDPRRIRAREGEGTSAPDCRPCPRSLPRGEHLPGGVRGSAVAQREQGARATVQGPRAEDRIAGGRAPRREAVTCARARSELVQLERGARELESLA